MPGKTLKVELLQNKCISFGEDKRCPALGELERGNEALACLLFAYQVRGKEVTCLEGMNTEGRCRIVQKVFMQEGVSARMLHAGPGR